MDSISPFLFYYASLSITQLLTAMKTVYLPSLLLCFALLTTQASESLPRATPESQGISSAKLLELVDALDEQIDGIHSLMIVRHGRVVAEGWWKPYDAAGNHVLYSLSKSFTSTAVGFAVSEGRLSIDDEVLKFFPDDAPEEPSYNLKAMRVRDLLTMTTGHQDEPSAAPDVVSAKSFLAAEVPHTPGTHFKYNTAATFMQSAIVQKVTGQTVLDYLRPRLFEPLGIAKPEWDTNFEGISLGGYGLRVRTEDIAKLGQLYLQQGEWDGKQLLPEEWVSMATSKQVSNGSNPENDWNQGYGFQFWRCRHNAFRGDGAFGQYCIVMPEQDMVVAITSGLRDMASVMNVLWEQLLPAVEGQRLRRDRDSQAALQQRLSSLSLPTAEGTPTPASAAKYLNRQYTFAENDQDFENLSLRSSDDNKTLTLSFRIAGRDVGYPCSQGGWRSGRGPLFGGRLAQFPDEPVAGSFGWGSDGTLLVKVTAYETPFQLRFELRFEGDELTLESETNVAFGPSKRPTLTARATE